MRQLLPVAMATLLLACGDAERRKHHGSGSGGDGGSGGATATTGPGPGPGPGAGGSTATSTGSSGGSPPSGPYELCVQTINDYRASVGVAPLARWTSAESCSDGEAQSDSMTMTPHGAFGSCGEFAQDECPGWPGPPESMITGCLAAMWAEGPGGGHYDNMSNPSSTEVACGYFVLGDGSVWAVQNFR